MSNLGGNFSRAFSFTPENRQCWMPQGIGLANRLSPHFNIDRQDSNIVLQGSQAPFSHNGHKSAGKMTLKSSEKINRISICYYLSQLGSLPFLVSNKLTNCCLIDFDRLWQWA